MLAHPNAACKIKPSVCGSFLLGLCLSTVYLPVGRRDGNPGFQVCLYSFGYVTMAFKHFFLLYNLDKLIYFPFTCLKTKGIQRGFIYFFLV